MPLGGNEIKAKLVSPEHSPALMGRSVAIGDHESVYGGS